MTKFALAVDSASKLDDKTVELVDYLIYSPSDYSRNDGFFGTYKSAYLSLPPYQSSNDVAKLTDYITNNSVKGVFVNNVYGIQLANQLNLKAFVGSLNIYNAAAVENLTNLLDDKDFEFLYSPELNTKEIADINTTIDKRGFALVHGDLCAMFLTHCVSRLNYGGSCDKCKYRQGTYYKDDKGYEFALRRVKVADCYFELYNGAKICTLNKLKKTDFNYYFNMINYNKQQIRQVLLAYKNPKGQVLEQNYTSGHLFRGVK